MSAISNMCEKKPTGDCEECRQREVLRLGITVAVGLWIGNLVLAASFALFDKSDKFGQFGDSFGMVNALFSSVAVAGAVYAVILQQRELSLTREEMRQAREAHEDSADAQERMAAIQGYSTMLSDLSQELEYFRSRRDEVRQLRLNVDGLIRENPEAVRTRNFPANLQKLAMDYFRDAEGLSLWTQKLYQPPGMDYNTADDTITLSKKLTSEFEAIVTEIMRIQDQKAEIVTQLQSAIAAKRST